MSLLAENVLVHFCGLTAMLRRYSYDIGKRIKMNYNFGSEAIQCFLFDQNGILRSKDMVRQSYVAYR